MNQFLISTAGNDAIGQTKTWATVTENSAPAGSVTLAISTTYSKARNGPDSHQVKQTIFFQTKAELANYARFLLNNAVEAPKVTTLGEPFSEPFAN